MTDAPDRHAQRRAETHHKLLDAAREVILEKGYDRTEIIDITDHANVSRGTFYQHFTGKEDCVRELMQRGFDALAIEVTQNRPADGSGEMVEWVRRGFGKGFAWAEDNRELVLILFGGAASPELNIFARSYIVDLIERTQAGRLPNDRHSPEVMAQVITGVFTQLVVWWLENDVEVTADGMADLTLDVLMNGVIRPRQSD